MLNFNVVKSFYAFRHAFFVKLLTLAAFSGSLLTGCYSKINYQGEFMFVEKYCNKGILTQDCENIFVIDDDGVISMYNANSLLLKLEYKVSADGFDSCYYAPSQSGLSIILAREELGSRTNNCESTPLKIIHINSKGSIDTICVNFHEPTMVVPSEFNIRSSYYNDSVGRVLLNDNSGHIYKIEDSVFNTLDSLGVLDFRDGDIVSARTAHSLPLNIEGNESLLLKNVPNYNLKKFYTVARIIENGVAFEIGDGVLLVCINDQKCRIISGLKSIYRTSKAGYSGYLHCSKEKYEIIMYADLSDK
jgi:hypothetical protein